jgi:hemerythrin
MGIKWDNAMASGVDTVDQQHRSLIAQLNALLDAMAAGHGRTAIEPILTALGEYTKVHFTHEEACMRKYACPVAAQNISAHKHFIATFQEIDREYRTNGPSSSLAIRVQHELASWLAGHIKGIDANLRACVPA